MKVGASGDITPSDGELTSDGVVWSREGAGPSMATPLLYAGHVYVPSQRGGRVSCYNAETGEIAYEDPDGQLGAGVRPSALKDGTAFVYVARCI